MSLLEMPQVIQDAVAAHEAFRRMGFPSDAIFVQQWREANSASPHRGRMVLGVVVKWSGKEFRFTIGQYDVPDEKFALVWAAAATAWNAGGPDNQTLWSRSQVCARNWFKCFSPSRPRDCSAPTESR